MDKFYSDHFKKFLEENAKENNSISDQRVSQTEHIIQSPSDIVYENDDLKLIVEKTFFKRQKNFKLQDHLFNFRILQKSSSEKLPLIIDILDFLHAAFIHVLDSIKAFYEKGKLIYIDNAF